MKIETIDNRYFFPLSRYSIFEYYIKFRMKCLCTDYRTSFGTFSANSSHIHLSLVKMLALSKPAERYEFEKFAFETVYLLNNNSHRTFCEDMPAVWGIIFIHRNDYRRNGR